MSVFPVDMRILHTADWHLGQRLHGYDRAEEHAHFFRWLLAQLRHYQPNAMLVAGDVFDSLNPSAQAQRQYYELMGTLGREFPELQVVVCAGNHDSGLRLEAASPLLRCFRIEVRGTVTKDADGQIDYQQFAVPLQGVNGDRAICLAIPYLRVADCPKPSVDGETPYMAFFRELATAYKDCNTAVILMGHLYAAGASTSTGKALDALRGGAEAIGREAFPEEVYRYVALGHIHRRQRVFGQDTICYSGAPLAMNFGEKGYGHSVNVVDINGADVQVTQVEYTPLVDLLQLAGSVEEVLEQIRRLPEGEVDEKAPIGSFEIRVETPSATLKHDLEECARGKYLRLGPMRLLLPQNTGNMTIAQRVQASTFTPQELAEMEFEAQYGSKMPLDMAERLGIAIKAAIQHEDTGD